MEPAASPPAPPVPDRAAAFRDHHAALVARGHEPTRVAALLLPLLSGAEPVSAVVARAEAALAGQPAAPATPALPPAAGSPALDASTPAPVAAAESPAPSPPPPPAAAAAAAAPKPPEFVVATGYLAFFAEARAARAALAERLRSAPDSAATHVASRKFMIKASGAKTAMSQEFSVPPEYIRLLGSVVMTFASRRALEVAFALPEPAEAAAAAATGGSSGVAGAAAPVPTGQVLAAPTPLVVSSPAPPRLAPSAAAELPPLDGGTPAAVPSSDGSAAVHGSAGGLDATAAAPTPDAAAPVSPSLPPLIPLTEPVSAPAATAVASPSPATTAPAGSSGAGVPSTPALVGQGAPLPSPASAFAGLPPCTLNVAEVAATYELLLEAADPAANGGCAAVAGLRAALVTSLQSLTAALLNRARDIARKPPVITATADEARRVYAKLRPLAVAALAPFLEDPDHHEQLVGPLCRAVERLPQHGRDVLAHWLADAGRALSAAAASLSGAPRAPAGDDEEGGWHTGGGDASSCGNSVEEARRSHACGCASAASSSQRAGTIAAAAQAVASAAVEQRRAAAAAVDAGSELSSNGAAAAVAPVSTPLGAASLLAEPHAVSPLALSFALPTPCTVATLLEERNLRDAIRRGARPVAVEPSSSSSSSDGAGAGNGGTADGSETAAPSDAAKQQLPPSDDDSAAAAVAAAATVAVAATDGVDAGAVTSLLTDAVADAEARLCRLGLHAPSELPWLAMRRCVDWVQQWVTLMIYSHSDDPETGEDEEAAARRRGVSLAEISPPIKLLGVLNAANEEHYAATGRRAVPFASFYNDVISSEISLSEDFDRWLTTRRGGRDVFSFCGHPFVLDAAAKAIVLQHDAQREQSEQAGMALFASLLGMGAGGMASRYFVLPVRREHLVEDALTGIVNVANKSVLKRPLKVTFAGEEGVDAGGVRKEMFQLLTRRLLVPEFGMFTEEAGAGGRRYLWPNCDSLEPPVNFELVGSLLGLALFNSVILDVAFPLVLYRKLKKEQLSLRDLDDFQPSVAKSLRTLLAYGGDDFEDVFGLTFCVTREAWGVPVSVDLVPGGADKPVTKANRRSYVAAYLKWLLTDAIRPQFDAFARGFANVAGGPALDLFRAEELALCVTGSPALDFGALQAAAVYEAPYTKDSPTVRWLWEVVHALPPDEQRAFLSFCTGSDRAPIRGLGSIRFEVIRSGAGDSDALPSASTCFNVLHLPEYSSKEKLQAKLRAAIREGAEGFGLV